MGYENWLKNAMKYLHSDHYLIIGVKYTLNLLYGKVAGFMIQDMNEDQLRRKMNICEDILRIADTVEPGLSRLRGRRSHHTIFILTGPIRYIYSFRRNNIIRTSSSDHDATAEI